MRPVAGFTSLIAQMEKEAPASPRAFEVAADELGLSLPEDYLQFLTFANGAEGFVGEHYLILWSAEELGKLNKAYDVKRYAPGLLVFGSSGGGESCGFDTRRASWTVVMTPFVGLDWELAKPVGDSFMEFLCVLAGTGQSSHILNPATRAKEVFEIQPILFGGSAVDPSNKAILTREQHIQSVNFWNPLAEQTRAQRRR